MLSVNSWIRSLKERSYVSNLKIIRDTIIETSEKKSMRVHEDSAVREKVLLE